MAGKSKGTKNYKKELLLKAVAQVKPTSTDMWRKAYVKYQLLAADVTEREPEDVKRYFWETMCKKGIKPTGKAAPDPIVERSVKVWARILQKNEMASYGGEDSSAGEAEAEESSDNESDDGDSSQDNDKDDANAAAAANSALFTPDRDAQSDEKKKKNEPENDIPEKTEKKAKKSNSKRKASNKTDDDDEDDEDISKDNKSKNVRNTPRAGGAGALMKMAEAMNREVDLRALEMKQNFEMQQLRIQMQNSQLQMQMFMAAAASGQIHLLPQMMGASNHQHQQMGGQGNK